MLILFFVNTVCLCCVRFVVSQITPLQLCNECFGFSPQKPAFLKGAFLTHKLHNLVFSPKTQTEVSHTLKWYIIIQINVILKNPNLCVAYCKPIKVVWGHFFTIWEIQFSLLVTILIYPSPLILFFSNPGFSKNLNGRT